MFLLLVFFDFPRSAPTRFWLGLTAEKAPQPWFVIDFPRLFFLLHPFEFLWILTVSTFHAIPCYCIISINYVGHTVVRRGRLQRRLGYPWPSRYLEIFISFLQDYPGKIFGNYHCANSDTPTEYRLTWTRILDNPPSNRLYAAGTRRRNYIDYMGEPSIPSSQPGSDPH